MVAVDVFCSASFVKITLDQMVNVLNIKQLATILFLSYGLKSF